MLSSGKAFSRWDNPKIELFHGTSRKAAEAILREGVEPGLGRPNTDFGRGFYTTTSEAQARGWAAKFGRQASVVKLVADRLALRSLKTLAFVRGAADAEDFWSFVEHCRHPDRAEPITSEYYDVVYGPVAVTWGTQGRVVHRGYDQISFHGANGREFLRNAEFYPLEVLR